MSGVDGKTLTAATERLNVLLQNAEAGLVARNLGVEALVTIREGVYLFFGKSGSDWGLFISRPDCHTKIPLLAAGRADRIAAARHLTKLEEQLEQNALALARDLAGAIEVVEQYLYPTLPHPRAGAEEGRTA